MERKVQLSHGVYGQLMEKYRPFRYGKLPLKGLYGVYEQFRNTFAQTLSTNIKAHNFKAKARHYESARQAALRCQPHPGKCL